MSDGHGGLYMTRAVLSQHLKKINLEYIWKQKKKLLWLSIFSVAPETLLKFHSFLNARTSHEDAFSTDSLGPEH